MSTQRFAFVVDVVPERREEYIRLHAHVWPQVEALLSAHHVTNYSIFLLEDTLFGYYEYTGDDHDAGPGGGGRRSRDPRVAGADRPVPDAVRPHRDADRRVAPARGALAPAVRRLLDSHLHMWERDKHPQPWLDAQPMSAIDRDFPPDAAVTRAGGARRRRVRRRPVRQRALRDRRPARDGGDAGSRARRGRLARPHGGRPRAGPVAARVTGRRPPGRRPARHVRGAGRPVAGPGRRPAWAVGDRRRGPGVRPADRPPPAPGGDAGRSRPAPGRASCWTTWARRRCGAPSWRPGRATSRTSRGARTSP